MLEERRRILHYQMVMGPKYHSIILEGKKLYFGFSQKQIRLAELPKARGSGMNSINLKIEMQ